MVERLGWMDEVARVKLAKSLPVTDAKREAELLHAMEQEGARAGLPKAAVRAFFAGQMDAAKRYQEEWLKAHAGLKEDAASLPDLAKTVRPALDGIGKQMIAALVAARRDSDAVWDAIAAGRAALDRAGYSQAVQAPAIRGLELGLGVARNER